jgi:integrase
LFFRTTRQSDGKRVENKIPIGLVRQLPDTNSAWAEVARPHVPINRVDVRRGLTFGELAQHYAEHELVDCAESIRPKAHTTIKSYERVLRNRLLPRWRNRIALGIEPLEVEQWLRTLKKEGTLTLLAAGTGLRISECLGLQWQDVNFADGMIHVRRTWPCGQVGLPKSKASKNPVPFHC